MRVKCLPNLHKPSVLVANSVQLGVTISRLGDDPSSLLLLKILSAFGYFPVRVHYTDLYRFGVGYRVGSSLQG